MPQSSYRKKLTPEQQLAAAVHRAQEGKITVAGEGTLTNGKRFYIVASQSVPGMSHVIHQAGKSLACDCFAAQNGKVCVHRAAVFLHLKAQAVKQVAQVKQIATSAPKTPAAKPAAPAHDVADDQPDDDTDMDYYAAYASSYR